MNKRIALGAGLLTLVWALFMYGKAIPDETPSSLSAPVAAVPPEVTDVAGGQPAGVPQLTAAVAEGTSEPPPRNAEPAAEAPAAPLTPMPPSGHFEEMQRRFESESRDAAWANAEEPSIPPLLAEVGFPDDALDGEVTCRRTLCRVRLRVVEDDALALMKLAGKMQTTEVGLAYGAAEVVDDKTRIAVYLSPPRAPADPLPR